MAACPHPMHKSRGHTAPHACPGVHTVARPTLPLSPQPPRWAACGFVLCPTPAGQHLLAPLHLGTQGSHPACPPQPPYYGTGDQNTLVKCVAMLKSSFKHAALDRALFAEPDTEPLLSQEESREGCHTARRRENRLNELDLSCKGLWQDSRKRKKAVSPCQSNLGNAACNRMLLQKMKTVLLEPCASLLAEARGSGLSDGRSLIPDWMHSGWEWYKELSLHPTCFPPLLSSKSFLTFAWLL